MIPERKIIYIDNQETNYEVSSDGHVYNRKTNREVRGTIAGYEYRSVQLMINKKPRCFQVHRLVALMFIPNLDPIKCPIVDHIDRDKNNNNVSNLRWVSYQENSLNCERPVLKKPIYVESLEGYKPIPGYSNYLINKEGTVISKNSLRINKSQQRNNYLRVRLNNCYCSVHRLVWETFVGPIPDKMVIDHIDGNGNNNNLSNLRMISQSENVKHIYELGRGGAVSIKQYSKQGEFIAEYKSIKEAADMVKGSASAIRQAIERHGASSGFFWIRVDDDITIDQILKITTSGKPKESYLGVTQEDLNHNFINHYNSLAEAARVVNGYGTSIRRAIDGGRPCYGFWWKIDK